MSENPSCTFELDPQTWEVISIRLQADTDEEVSKLQDVLARGIRCRDLRLTESTAQ